MDEMKDILLEKVKDAELVLVGIGEEFGDNLSGMYEKKEFADFLEKIEGKEAFEWMIPYVQKIYLERCGNEEINKAYAILEKLLEEKNYFIISTCMDDYIYHTGLKTERIVTPCGGYRFLQCSEGCGEKLTEVDKSVMEAVSECIFEGRNPEEIEAPVCENCKKRLVFNNIKASNYIESGYLEQWNDYRKWLQGTVNRKLCVLELGVGMKYPEVIRWPFEKIVFFNQKSSMFRIHSKLYQLTEEIKDRGYKIKEKPTDFLINRFV